MRDYAKIKPSFWSGPTGKIIRELAMKHGYHIQVIALYLMTSQHANMIGLYHLPLVYMEHDTGAEDFHIKEALKILREVGFCDYDINTEMIWVKKMAKHQIAPELKAADKKVKGIQKIYKNLPNCLFLGDFFDYYKIAFHLDKKRKNAPSSASPSKAPTKPEAGTGAEAGAETVKEKAEVQAEPSPDITDQKFIRRLPFKGGGEYMIDGDYVETLVGLYPKIDVEEELRKMLSWLLANKRKLKTEDGMPRFIANWLNSAKGDGGGGNGGGSGKSTHVDKVADSTFSPEDEQHPEY